ncbi:MAG: hypothetical protein QG657_231 [Acidobacteriota bacterium]|nr:hypothetical protein [Acidobacteriota bacterium]
MTAIISKDRSAGIFLMTSWKHRVDAVLLNPALSLAGFPGSLTNQNRAGADSNAALKYNHKGKSTSHPTLARGITPPAGTITAYTISNGRIAIVFPRLALTNARLSPAIPWTAFTNDPLALANGALALANAAKLYTNVAKYYANGISY